MNKRLLALTWAMPPMIYPRALQISRLFKALHQRGWQIDVVTAHPDDMRGVRDKQFGALYADHYSTLLVRTGEDVEVTPLMQRVLRRLDPPVDFGMDNFFRRSLALLKHRIDTGDYDAFVTFAQPWVDHLIGLAVKQEYSDLPWVAHFSDPWSDNPLSAEALAESADTEALKAERQVISAADSVAFVSPETLELVMCKYEADLRPKAFVLPHAIDADLMGELPPYPRPRNQMHLVYTGSFYPGKRTPEAVMRALAKMNDMLNARDDVSIDFVGPVTEEYRQLLERMGLFGQVRFLGDAGYLTTLAAAANADALLLIDAPAQVSVFLPSKIVDYLMVDKPILGITPPNGASARVLRAAGHPVVAPDDDDAVFDLLAGTLKAWREGTLSTGDSQDVRTHHDMRQIAETFEARLYGICGLGGKE